MLHGNARLGAGGNVANQHLEEGNPLCAIPAKGQESQLSDVSALCMARPLSDAER